ncbi:MAG: DNA-processing protein DprA [Gammaproteobacteria bacterium]|uniref:DNA-processing protein DprA n=1 Tax=Rhodoferax sp. TaxID=50421 RepID=UPI0017CCAD2F|nr:DNA-processing protein DprA [Rhodoferax sp.]MBU3898525.1 DNA-processing protein DprA [Gammaproteobacteria bacterium]MBA3056826.1 hypothetical protein [Rhodoferax sp.]MBU3997852.1 DNA-processing protein DprA [Gammaproteobacteria bacterium]MBU4079300.1 DNA-processing protein DprA [Gammaproteobacteria bacterium]MBU4113238.1 DNA-processing protein DprA [Gammaproteobacteria bacterium]
MKTWHATHQSLALTGVGGQALLTQPMMAFFASRQCPGTAIRAAIDWALQQAQARQVVISGFHAPLEQSVLTVLLQARSPVVVVLARPVDGAKLPSAWVEPMAQGRVAVVSSVATAKRLTVERATLRNAQVAQLATNIVVAYASSGGSLADLLAKWRHTMLIEMFKKD